MSPEADAEALELRRSIEANLDVIGRDLGECIASADRTLACMAAMDARMRSMGDRAERIGTHVDLDKGAGG